MELRKELTPPPISEARWQEVKDRIERIEEVLDQGRDADDLIREFNEFTGRHYDEVFFRRYWRSIDLEDFVREASRRPPKPVHDVMREELVEVVRRAMSGPQGDAEYEFYFEIFDANVGVPGAWNLICYPPDYDPVTNTWGGGRQMGEYHPTPEEIVRQALAAAKGGGPAVSANAHLVNLWESFKGEHPPGTTVVGTAERVVPYGVHVDLGLPFDGILHVRFMAPLRCHKSFPRDFPSVGEVVTAMVRNYGEFAVPGQGGFIVLTQDPESLPKSTP